MARPSLASLAAVYFRIGNQTFGSGTTTVLLLSREFTERGWLTRLECDFYYALSRVVPGTNVLAFVSASASAIRSWRGAVAAIVAYTIPASAVVIALTLAYQRWHDHPIGGAAIATAMSAIVGIIVGAAWLLAAPRVRSADWKRTVALIAGAVLLSFWLSPLLILAIAAVAGYFWPERS